MSIKEVLIITRNLQIRPGHWIWQPIIHQGIHGSQMWQIHEQKMSDRVQIMNTHCGSSWENRSEFLFSSLVQKIGHANLLSSDKARCLGCQYTFIIRSCHDPFILSADGETVTQLEFHWCFYEKEHSTSTFMHLRQCSSCDTITPPKKVSFFPTLIIISSKGWQNLNLYLQKLIVLLNGS